MDTGAIASVFVAARAGETQLAVAAKMLKMNAEAAFSIVQLIDAAQTNARQLANVAAGVGGNLDVSV